MFPLRDENRSSQFPIVTILLLVLNVLGYGFELSRGTELDDFILKFGAVPADILHGVQLPYSTQPAPYWTLLTSLFLHANLVHLVGNMWFLWIFGDNVEAFFGRAAFLLFYLVCGVLASLAHIAFNADSHIPIIGASGAISGVLGAYMLIWPKVRVRTLLFLGFWIDIVFIPAGFFLGFWLLLQFFGGLNPGESQVAFAAHVGGFLAGVILTLLCSRRSPSAHFRTEPRRLPKWRRIAP